MEIDGKISAPVLAKILAALLDDVDARKARAFNSPAPALMGNGTGTDNSGLSASLTDAIIVGIPEAKSGGQWFSKATIFFQDTAGRLRFTVDGTPPKATGIGLPFLSGGGVLEIFGMNKIQKFAMVCETGQTANFVYLLER